MLAWNLVTTPAREAPRGSEERAQQDARLTGGNGKTGEEGGQDADDRGYDHPSGQGKSCGFPERESRGKGFRNA